MATLAQAIRSFQSGGLSHKELLAQIDHVLAADHANTARLRDLLSDEHTRIELPPEVYAELKRRVEPSPQVNPLRNGNGPGHGDDTFVITRSPEIPSHPAPSYPSMPSIPSVPSFKAGDTQAEPERMKGVGDTLNGRFVLEECIGFGGMGTVYKALDLRKLEASDRKPYIAIKVLNVQFRGHPKSLITLQREAKKAQALAHPNIVTVYDFDRDGATVFLTMEYLAGKPLSRILRAPDFKGMPFEKAWHIANGMGKALAYAHERGFVHCDLKPANVFITDRNEVKVIDFGISRVFQKPEDDADVTVFDPGSLGGLTPAYASPEMLERLEPDPRDDIYALACITYEMLAGRHPFDRMSATQARSIGMKPARPSHLGWSQWQALRHALAFERKSRTPTVARFVQEMSGRKSTAVYAAIAASSVAAIALVSGGVSYYLKSEPDTPAVAASSGGGAAGEAASGAGGTNGTGGAGGASGAGGTGGTAGASGNEAGSGQQKGSGHESAAKSSPPPATPVQPPVAAAPAIPAPAPAPAPAEAPFSLAAVAPVLKGIGCSALTASGRERERALQVQGYLSSDVSTARLKDMLLAVPGVRTVDLSLQQITEEKCEVIELLAPYWKANRTAGGHAAIRTQASNAILHEGDSLIVDVRTPSYDTYVYVDYYALDGGVAHLLPTRRARANQAPPNHRATIGGGTGNWIISKPFGNELIVLLVTPVPLFDGALPEFKTREEYLKALGKQLDQVAAKHGRERILADFVQITTKPGKR
ncbi:serine/threonine-protein kinase [Noviherbaspirillum aerium]|uniref:serine/threonine-protein kinase n=1 Tax=Noviherbaspirillum aerium TaxID=2588497 RepID=UPI00124C6F01|nr:serine/threonine-protein kinase [Noviherbaspirillum aerium]